MSLFGYVPVLSTVTTRGVMQMPLINVTVSSRGERTTIILIKVLSANSHGKLY